MIFINPVQNALATNTISTTVTSDSNPLHFLGLVPSAYQYHAFCIQLQQYQL